MVVGSWSESLPRWKTKAGVVVVEVARRRDNRRVKIAAYRAETGGWHGWLNLKGLVSA